MSVAFRPFAKDWYINNKIMDDFIKDMLQASKLDRTYDIPYLAGYSKSGKKFYIDFDMPKGYTDKAGKFIETDTYLMVHEFIEKTLEEQFLKKGIDAPYQICHQVALRVERIAVENDGVDWNEYNRFMMKEVKKIGSRKEYTNVPKDLDLKPYYDEKDKATLKKMHAESVEDPLQDIKDQLEILPLIMEALANATKL
jgi:hypothetical protein